MLKEHAIAILHPAQQSEYAEFRIQSIRSCIKSVRELFQESAFELGHRIRMKEHPLFYGSDGNLKIPSQKRRRRLREVDTTVVIDPSQQVLQFAAATNHQPIRRMLIVDTESRNPDEWLDTLHYMRVPLINGETMTRVFWLFLSPNEEEADDSYDNNITVVSKVLRYPAA